MSQAYIGEIVMFAGNFAPRNWALCNGQLISISTNAALFSILGTTYGGDGIRTFGLPDLRSRVPVHAGQGTGLSNYAPGQMVGTENITISTPQLPVHTHTATFAPTGSGTAPTIATAAVQGSLPKPDGNILAQPKQGAGSLDAYAPPSAATGTLGGVTGGTGGGGTVTVNPVGGGLPMPVIQPVLCVNFIICTAGIFPSRN